MSKADFAAGRKSHIKDSNGKCIDTHNIDAKQRRFTKNQILELMSMKHQTDVSIAQIARTYRDRDSKNISRLLVKDVWNGKCKLFPEEFTDDDELSYEQYWDLVQKPRLS